MVVRVRALDERKAESKSPESGFKKFEVKTEKSTARMLARIRDEIKNKKFENAEKKVKAILENEPQNRLALSMLIEINADRGDIITARKIFNNSRKVLITNSALESLKNAYIRIGDVDSAKNLFAGVSWDSPVILECKAAVKRFRFAGIEDKLQKILETDPHNVHAANLLIKFYFKTGKVEKAEEIFNAIVDVANGAVYKNMIKWYGRLGRTKDAIKTFRTAVENGAATKRVYNWMLIAYNGDNRIQESENLFKIMKERENVNAYSYNIMIMGYGKILDIEKAEEIFMEAAYEKNIADELTYIFMIEAYGKLGMISEAEELFLEALEKRMDSTRIYKTMIHVYGNEKDMGSAKHVYLLAVENGKGSDGVRNALLKFTTNQI